MPDLRKGFLLADEFIILSDNTCHLIQEVVNQAIYTPSVLYLTNRRIYLEPSIEGVDNVSIYINEIIELKQSDIYDCNAIEIETNVKTSIMISDPDKSKPFIDLVSLLTDAMKQGQVECDTLSLALQRKVLESNSLNEFFKSFNKSNVGLTKTEPRPVPLETSIIDSIGQISPFFVLLIKIAEELISIDESLAFSITFPVVLLFSVIFRFFNFGVWICGAIFLILAIHGLYKIFAKTPKKKEIMRSFENTNNEISSKDFISSFRKFIASFHKRVLWENPRQTLEVVMFLLSAGLLFASWSPLLVLGTTIVGLAYLERWNPFGFGSLSDILSNFFKF
ncbi:hypothetical protein GPJ56_006721 [Histomonas meleagridis]|uniref:uncharacterized protein n=1 Tax=Histomonas meleagridis TaxID=135588 RepID=UPI003559A247|nr:hypothetical protein GPJ56_006721 [Histomonas meleagridis]KAH0805917.1 hypothetical protein GO595_001248 [Histomonas meleagridis]